MPLVKLAEHFKDPVTNTESVGGHEHMDIYEKTTDNIRKRRKLDSETRLSSSWTSSEFEIINVRYLISDKKCHE